MILVGQYDLPFVPRFAVALNILSLRYTHRSWSTFGDANRLIALNALRRVPALLLDDGEMLIERAAVLDHLNETAGEARPIATSDPARRTMLGICAVGIGPSSDWKRGSPLRSRGS